MNKSFKVVFNKARGALMVVNEVTSSVQAKGTKTVIATAVALVAGAAVAAPEISTTPDVDTTVTEWVEVPAEGVITTDKTIAWDEVKADGQYHYTTSSGTSAFTTLTKEKGEFAGKLWVSASGEANATGLEVKGEGVELTNKGEIYVTTDETGVEWKNEAILAENNAKAVNAGKIVVKNAYGMRVGRNAPATIENAGTIIVEEQGAGMELGGGTHSVGSVATNNGSIIVGDIAEGKYGHGVLIKDAKDVVLNNNGLIQAGEGATAIDVQLDGETSAEINLGEKSQIDGLIKIGEGTKVTLNAKGMTGKLKVQAADGTTVAVAGIEVAEGTKTLSITGEGEVLLRGDTASGNVFEGTEALDALDVAGDLTLGYEASNKGGVNAETIKVAGELDVVGDFTAQNVEVGSAYVDGALALNSLKVAEAGVATVKNGTLHLLGAAEDAAEIDGKVNVTGTGLLTTNKAAANAYIAQLDDEEPSAVLYVDRAMKLADGAEVVIGNAAGQQIALLAEGGADAAPAATASVKVQEGGYALVDVTNFIGSEEAVFGDNADVIVDNNAALDLINVNKTGEVKLGASIAVTNGGDLDTDSLYIGVDEEGFADGIVTLKYFGNIVADRTVDARLAALFAKGASAKEMAILNELQADKFIQEDANGHESFNSLGNKALEQATGGNATAGVLNVAYDANAQVTDAIVRHQLSDHAGMGVWADVFYAKNEAKKLYGDFGYSADIYGGVLGFDYTAACGGTLGAALTVGTADADSEGGALSNSLSSDFVGFSVYASKDFSGLNVKADLGYIDFSNDFSGLGDASDASTITFGVRGDFTAYQNGAFSIAPHFGLRYTRIDTDAVAFNDEQNMNVFEAPVGVKFAGTFETAGWKVVPSYDFTIVPQLGDKDVEAFGTAGDVTILSGGLYNNVIGVEAVNGNLSFGLNASYGFGPDDRANTQVNANIRYNF